MNDYDVQMAEAESSDTRAGDYSRRYRDRQILLRQYPGPDAKRFFSWTRGPLAQHRANKGAPSDMPNAVMDLSYALDHKPGETTELEELADALESRRAVRELEVLGGRDAALLTSYLAL